MLPTFFYHMENLLPLFSNKFYITLFSVNENWVITVNLTFGKLVLISVLSVTDYVTRPCTDVSK